MFGSHNGVPRFSLGPNGRCSTRHLRRHVSRTVWDASFASMNGYEQMSTKLEAGDRARFQFDSHVESGSLWMELVAPDGAILFRLDGGAAETYALTAALPGRYRVRVTADRAAGGFRVELLPGEL
jgi:hypothetical protein